MNLNVVIVGSIICLIGIAVGVVTRVIMLFPFGAGLVGVPISLTPPWAFLIFIVGSIILIVGFVIPEVKDDK